MKIWFALIVLWIAAVPAVAQTAPGVEEEFPTAEAADARANQLYAAGYDVVVIYSRTRKDDRARGA